MYSVIPRPSPNYGTTEQISKYDSGSQMEWRELLGVKATRRKRDKGNNTADKSKSTAKHRGGTRTVVQTSKGRFQDVSGRSSACFLVIEKGDLEGGVWKPRESINGSKTILSSLDRCLGPPKTVSGTGSGQLLAHWSVTGDLSDKKKMSAF